MKRILLFVFLFTTFLVDIKPQVFTGDITLRSQADVDNFNFSSVTGSVFIEESSPGSITNLSGLSELSSIGATLRINHLASLTNLDGLSNLTSVNFLNIVNNPALQNVNALGKLTSVQRIHFEGNPALMNIDGLTGITSLQSLEIIQNNSLVNLNGISNITSAGSIEITRNKLLSNIDPLSKITLVPGRLTISTNQSLQNLNGLSNVTGLGSLYIIGNASLTDLDALLNVKKIEGIIYISSNEKILNLDGLSNAAGNITELDIINNKSLLNIKGLNKIIISNGYYALSVYSNPSLKSLEGVHITDNTVSIYIADNASLEDINAIGNLRTLSYLFINNNPSLSRMDLFCNLTSVAFDLYIQNTSAMLISFPKLEVVGNLKINGNHSLVNLQMPKITKVDGNLEIRDNLKLETLEGLSAIKSVQYGFYVDGNIKLKNLDALSNLTGIGGINPTADLFIRGNSSLMDINGLSNLSSIGNSNYPGSISIINNNALLNIDVLSRLHIPLRKIVIDSNKSIISLKPLSGIKSVYENITISNNPALQSLDGIQDIAGAYFGLIINNNDALQNVDILLNNKWKLNGLTISDNDALTNVDGFSKITGEMYNLTIRNNKLLTNINAFSNLSLHFIEITGNPMLTEFCGLFQTLTNGYNPNVIIENNGANPTVDEIILNGPCKPAEFSFLTVLLGKNEIPEVQTNSSGGGMFVLNAARDTLKFWIRLCELSGPIISAGFYDAPEGDEGPLVKTITTTFAGDSAHGIWTTSDEEPFSAALLTELLAGNIYLNINTELHPNGEIKGQLTYDKPLTCTAKLNGSQMVPPNNTQTSANAIFSISGNADKIQFFIDLDSEREEILSATLNSGPLGVNGPVIMTTPTFGSGYNYLYGVIGDPESIPEPLAPEQVANLLGCHLYLDVVTSNGEIRGQIYRSSESSESISTDLKELNTIPGKYVLEQNYPNPFNPSTVISWQLAVGSFVTLKIYDAIGNEVAALVNEEKPAGKYSIEWKPDGLASGIYFCRINAGSFSAVRKMIFLK